MTSDAYNWSSSNTAVATLPNSYASFVGIGSATGATYVQLQEALLRLNCPVNTYNPQNTMNSYSLTCSPSTVSWGASVSCTVHGASASQVTGWTFSGDGLAVNGPTGVLTWSGPMVVGGTITATIAGASRSPTATVTVNARSTFASVTLPAPQLVSNGATVNGVTLPTLASPPTTDEGSFGQSAYAFGFFWATAAAASGPNAGLYYVTSFTDSSAYVWELNPGVTNSSDPFYQNQGQGCFPTIAQIVSAVQAHEVGTPGPSHYSEVQAALASNNPGLIANSAIGGSKNSAPPGIQAAYQAAVNAGKAEPPTNLPANINYPPYRSCP